MAKGSGKLRKEVQKRPGKLSRQRCFQAHHARFMSHKNVRSKCRERI